MHTCQSLELETVGVIIGPDLIVRNGEVITNASMRAKSDATVKGYKTLLKSTPQDARTRPEMAAKNTYRALLTRGQKRCLVWSVDPETNEYLKRSGTLV